MISHQQCQRFFHFKELLNTIINNLFPLARLGQNVYSSELGGKAENPASSEKAGVKNDIPDCKNETGFDQKYNFSSLNVEDLENIINKLIIDEKVSLDEVHELGYVATQMKNNYNVGNNVNDTLHKNLEFYKYSKNYSAESFCNKSINLVKRYSKLI